MSAFIHRLKKEPEQYLERSIILVTKFIYTTFIRSYIFYTITSSTCIYCLEEKDDIQKILINLKE